MTNKTAIASIAVLIGTYFIHIKNDYFVGLGIILVAGLSFGIFTENAVKSII